MTQAEHPQTVEGRPEIVPLRDRVMAASTGYELLAALEDPEYTGSTEPAFDVEANHACGHSGVRHDG